MTDAPDTLDVEYARHKRFLRWYALHDDSWLGLTPGEQSELDKLNEEFGTDWPHQ